MGWKTIKNIRYFYEYVEVDGERVWKCWGSGTEAELASRRVRAQREENRKSLEIVRYWRQEDAATDKRVRFNKARADRDIREMYEAAGYHQHKRQWRKQWNRKRLERGTSNDSLMELKDLCLLKRAPMNRGFEDAVGLETEIRLLAIESLRRVVEDVGETIKVVFDKIAVLQAELKYESSTAMERMLIDQVLTAWVQWYVASRHLEAEEIEARDWRKNQYLERRYVRCQNRLSRLIDQLARIRCVPRFFLEDGRRSR